MESMKRTLCNQVEYSCSDKNLQRDFMRHSSQREIGREMRGLIFSKRAKRYISYSHESLTHTSVCLPVIYRVRPGHIESVSKYDRVTIFQFLCLNYDSGRITIIQDGEEKKEAERMLILAYYPLSLFFRAGRDIKDLVSTRILHFPRLYFYFRLDHCRIKSGSNLLR